MCYYCRYLAHEKSKNYGGDLNDEGYFAKETKCQRKRSCHLATILRLLSVTVFFAMFNITIVLSQSSHTQQRDQSSSKILELNSRDVFGTNKVYDQNRESIKDSKNSHVKSPSSIITTTTSSTITIPPPKTKRLTHEKRLIRDLLNNYPTTYARPIRNISQPLVIQFGLTLTQLFDLGSTGQKMQTNTWKTFIWKDMNLVWNPSDYGGLATVCLPADSIWTPDIVLYNYADERLKDWRDISAVIQHTGDILYVPATMQFSVCFLDITKFPYDIHQCSLLYRSWTYDHTKVLLEFKENISAMDMTSYLDSNEWKVVALPAEKTITEDKFSLLTYTLIIQRRGGLYGYILILPCLLLSAATMVVFWIPPESPAKMILTVSIFSGLFLLLLLLAESIPGGGGTPNIGYYYCVNMVVVSITAVLATTVIHIYVRGDRRQGIPLSVRRLFLQYLARLYCMSSKPSAPVPDTNASRYGPPSPGALLLPENILLTHHYHEEEFSKKLKLLKQRFNEFHRQQQYSSTTEASFANDTMSALSLNLRSIENDLKEVRDYLRHMKKKIENNDKSNKNADDWKQVALVLDRTFFFAYCFWFVMSVFVMFPKMINISRRNSPMAVFSSLQNNTLSANNLTTL